MPRYEHKEILFKDVRPGEEFSWPEHYNKGLVKFQEPIQGFNAVSKDFGSLVQVPEDMKVLHLEKV